MGQKERKESEDKESTLKKLCTKAGKKLKKVKELAPDIIRAVMNDESDDECITLDSDDEGIDFTSPSWMEEFLTDEQKTNRDVKPNLEELNQSIDAGKEKETEADSTRPQRSKSPSTNGVEVD